MTNASGMPANRKAAILLLLAALFFAFQYNPYVQINEETFSEDLFEALGTIDTGNVRRQAALLLLGILALPFVLRRRNAGGGIDGWPGWALALFLFWCFLSALWSDQPALSARRLLAFAMICIGALGFARTFTTRDLLLFAWAATAAFLAIGAAAELLSGTFRPLQGEYRFSGWMHPNSQAMNCAILILSSVSIAFPRERERRRVPLLAMATVAFVFLFLTKSRTTMAGVGFALAALFLLRSRLAGRAAFTLGAAWIVCFALLFLPGEALVSVASRTVFPGREISDYRTLTGRTDIWEACLQFISERPVFGYGYGAFWDEHRILKMESIAGWAASHGHSTYIDLMLSLGVAGLLLFLASMAGGILRAVRHWVADGSAAAGFLFCLLLYCLVQGLMETVLPNPGMLNFVVLSGLFLLAGGTAAGEGEAP